MKMVKSLLLGSAAGFMAVAGAQAADMPVKAAPVEYVKICSLYGAGFYYIPGTDTCVKIGGWVRFQAFVGNNNNGTSLFYAIGAQNTNTLLGQTAAAGSPGGSDFSLRARATISMDTRSQTEWGTVRTYMNIGWTANTGFYGVNVQGSAAQSGECLYVNRGFIQWAGFTFGRAQSFYDLMPYSSFYYFANANNDTGDAATLLGAYTTQWGNGISTTFSVEESRVIGVLNTDVLGAIGAATFLGGGTAVTGNNFGIGANINNDYVQQRVPDLVSNFRIDQAWGSFQVMTALHDASAAYYTSDAAGACANVASTAAGTINMNCGHPGDKWGWAVGVGAVINLPFIAKGDRFAFQVNTAEGAMAYVVNQPGARQAPNWYGGAYSLAAAWIQDSVLRNTVPGQQTGSLELTSGWGFTAAFEHFWTPSLRTSWYGGAYQIDYNANATTYLCSKTALALTPTGGNVLNAAGNRGANPLCDPDNGVWYVGTRTQWNIRPDFYMGVDLLYSQLQTAHNGAFAILPFNNSRPASGLNYRMEDQEALALTFRVQRDIVP